jgi:hypothetical protein
MDAPSDMLVQLTIVERNGPGGNPVREEACSSIEVFLVSGCWSISWRTEKSAGARLPLGP